MDSRLRPFLQRLAILEGISDGVKYLHEVLNIIHGDLKSGNILAV